MQRDASGILEETGPEPSGGIGAYLVTFNGMVGFASDHPDRPRIDKLDDEEMEAIRRSLAQDREKAHRETAAMHHIEVWRDRLIEEGDEALAQFIALHPLADRQHLRQLARNALAERKANKPPHAFRELFRELRELVRD